MVDENLCKWHELLSMVLWTIRTSNPSSTTPYAFITYGHEAILHGGCVRQSLWVAIQN